MAKSNSFNKREIEKKKQSKRQEKQQKKEARKASGVSSLDDMIAYVDENGMITDTPPDLTKKEEIDIENIVISTPKKEELDEPAELKGRVEFFDTSRGYGFIKSADNTDKYFFHMSSLQEEVTEGDIVYYELIKGIKGLNAINIRIVK
jgi:Cold shock proteins